MNFKKLKNFINGEFLPPISGKYLESFNPATGEVYCLIPDSEKADIDLAVEAAKKAFPVWSGKSTQERSILLNKIADRLEERKEEFARAESTDQGKPLTLARTVDIPRAIHNFRFFAGYINYQEENCTLMDNLALNYTVRKPLGVAGLISPWNLPLYLLTWKIAPALASGNTAVCKPSEFTSATALLLGEVFNEVGMPPGVCNIISGTGGAAGKNLVTHPDVPLISFTGGTETGKKIIIDSAPYFKKLSLELGGKNPNIIFADADLDECVKTSIRSSFQNQGEICLCGSRIFVEKSIYEKFLKKFLAETEKIVVGDPFSETTNMGPLVSQEHFAKVCGYISLAEETRQKILSGGEMIKNQGKGYYLQPTVIESNDPSCRLMQEEIFGPVVTVTPFENEEEVITYANSTRYGLSATIWTRDLKRAHQVAQKLEAGTVWINTWMLRDLRVPFGGMKASGLGREGGKYSFDFYTEVKNICVNLQ